MSDFGSQSFDQDQHSDTVVDENFEDDDLIAFQHDSKTINLYLSQLIKYSKHVREKCLLSDVINSFHQEIHKFQEEYQLFPDNIELFFQLSQQNYNINDNLILTYVQCTDLLKISDFLEVRKLTSKINQYIKSQKVNVDFIIQMIEYDAKTQIQTNNCQIKISTEMENLLTSKINECLSNEKFKELPIEIIYRIVKQSSPSAINYNKLYDIIIKSLSKFCVLFQFLDLQKLSDNRLEELCEMYSKSNEKTRHYFDYLKCNLNFINEISNSKKNLQEMNDQQRNRMKELDMLFQNKINDSEKVNAKLQSQLNDSNNLINEQKNKMKDLEEKIKSLQNQFNDLKNLNYEQQNKMKEKETLLQKQFNEQFQNQIKYSKELENQINQLQKKLTCSEKEIVENKKHVPFKGQIVASVEKEVFINAEINLTIQHGILDTTKSKVIISTSDAKYLGSEAYEKGEPITSLHMTTRFVCKIGLYYVRCIVFNIEGESNEIVSNSVTTSGSNLPTFQFDYTGEPAKISLPQGQYKLEVWGAKGGDSTGTKCNSPQPSKGGLGGYSCGILKLNKQENIYIYVGGEGRPANSSEGSISAGGFPDGGGTTTSHCGNYTAVPGTGGGSTSIRLTDDTNYTRVIVAGGGGGASGSKDFTDCSGFGGGLKGGNSNFWNKQGNSGSGTQTGSTCGEGGGCKGDQGSFGKGADGKYLSGRDSGGGGGGGWYGGGSGGYGQWSNPGSGGGGSGWTFTEATFSIWKSGDSNNSSKFALNSSYYLTDAVTLSGNEEFPRPDGKGTELGHSGNRFLYNNISTRPLRHIKNCVCFFFFFYGAFVF